MTISVPSTLSRMRSFRETDPLIEIVRRTGIPMSFRGPLVRNILLRQDRAVDMTNARRPSLFAANDALAPIDVVVHQADQWPWLAKATASEIPNAGFYPRGPATRSTALTMGPGLSEWLPQTFWITLLPEPQNEIVIERNGRPVSSDAEDVSDICLRHLGLGHSVIYPRYS